MENNKIKYTSVDEFFKDVKKQFHPKYDVLIDKSFDLMQLMCSRKDEKRLSNEQISQLSGLPLDRVDKIFSGINFEVTLKELIFLESVLGNLITIDK